MTDHLHSTHVPGCFRCELREDEARDHQAAEADLIRVNAEYHGLLSDAEAERDALAARLAAVEAERDALADEVTRVRAAVAQALRQHPDDLTALEVRAALAAPTDTTKEN